MTAFGQLWKSNAYQAIQGVLSPIANSDVAVYNLWLLYEEPKRKQWTISVPYSEFLELARNLKSNPPISKLREDGRSEWQFGADTMKRVLDWCSGHGLLGILPWSGELRTQMYHVVFAKAIYHDASN